MAKISEIITKYAWVPIPFLLISVIYAKLFIVDFSYDNNLIVLILNLIFTTLASLVIIYLLSRSFLKSGRLGLILISSGVIIWGFSGFLSLIFGNDSNAAVTIHNLCVCLSSFFYLSGAIIWSKQSQSVKFPGLWLTILYSVTLTFIALIIIFTTSGRIPSFFVEDKGGTALRYYVLILSITLFIATAIILRLFTIGFLFRFLYWYSIALALISIGLLGVMLENRLGDIVSWIGRSAQFLSGVYMMIAAFTAVKETNAWELSIENDLNNKRREAEDAFKKSDERYRQIIELAGEGIIITDEKFLIMEWNRAAEILYGWTEEEVIRKNSREILRSNLNEAELEKLLNELAEKDVTQYEAAQRRKDGSLIMIEAKLSVIRDPDGRISGYIAMNRDITERKKTEEDLIKTKESLLQAVVDAEHQRMELKVVLDNAPIAIWIAHDPECRNITGNRYANERIMKVSGEVNISASALPGNEIVGYRVFRNGKELRPEEMPAQVTVATGKPFEHEVLELRFSDGRKVFLLEGAVPRFDGEANIIGAIITGMDVTLQRESEEALKESEHKLNLALENSNIGIWQWNLNTHEICWDERMETIFGLKPGTFGKTLEAFESLVREEDLPRLHKGISEMIENDRPYDSLYRTIPVNGKSKYISSKALVNKDPDGKAVSVTGVTFDVTNLVEGAESKILDLNEELLKSNKELENFAYIASHDLQEPLRMVTSFTQLLQQRYSDKLDEDANTYINYAVDGSKRMYALLNGLLEYSRIKSRGREFSVVNMNSIISKVKANLKLKLDETKTEINCSDLPVIVADENQMIQIIQNLVENGIKFSHNKPVITISSMQKDGFDIFSVKDEGIGIEPQYYERIFRIFQRLHSQYEYGGMGLGLSICQRIVERHGGNIWVESIKGQGSSFYFSIPQNSHVRLN
jgi:PAS domain S-box-containing protein